MVTKGKTLCLSIRQKLRQRKIPLFTHTKHNRTVCVCVTEREKERGYLYSVGVKLYISFFCSMLLPSKNFCQSLSCLCMKSQTHKIAFSVTLTYQWRVSFNIKCRLQSSLLRKLYSLVEVKHSSIASSSGILGWLRLVGA